jgi:uncharacterized protein YkwD
MLTWRADGYTILPKETGVELLVKEPYYMAYILIFVALSPIYWGSIAFAKPVNTDAITVANVIMLTNKSRSDDGLSPLEENSFLVKLAQFKANDMAAHQSISHVDSSGNNTLIYDPQFSERGENLATLFTSGSAEENAFMASPDHRQNILNPQYTEVGVGIAKGDYQGYPTTYVAVEFAD